MSILRQERPGLSSKKFLGAVFWQRRWWTLPKFLAAPVGRETLPSRHPAVILSQAAGAFFRKRSMETSPAGRQSLSSPEPLQARVHRVIRVILIWEIRASSAEP